MCVSRRPCAVAQVEGAAECSGRPPRKRRRAGGGHAGICAEERRRKGHQEQRVRRQDAQKRKRTPGALGQHAVPRREGGGRGRKETLK